jgi:hypothetical protein
VTAGPTAVVGPSVAGQKRTDGGAEIRVIRQRVDAGPAAPISPEQTITLEQVTRLALTCGTMLRESIRESRGEAAARASFRADLHGPMNFHAPELHQFNEAPSGGGPINKAAGPGDDGQGTGSA